MAINMTTFVNEKMNAILSDEMRNRMYIRNAEDFDILLADFMPAISVLRIQPVPAPVFVWAEYVRNVTRMAEDIINQMGLMLTKEIFGDNVNEDFYGLVDRASNLLLKFEDKTEEEQAFLAWYTETMDSVTTEDVVAITADVYRELAGEMRRLARKVVHYLDCTGDYAGMFGMENDGASVRFSAFIAALTYLQARENGGELTEAITNLSQAYAKRFDEFLNHNEAKEIFMRDIEAYVSEIMAQYYANI